MPRQPRHSTGRPARPEGQITRGKTAPNRLRRVDAFLAAYDRALLTRRDGDFARALYVDLGYGASPTTTLESAARLRRVQPRLGVLGVEIDPERVARAQVAADRNTAFRLGGFNLPLGQDAKGRPETVRLVRAFNVLRQYDPDEVRSAYGQIMAQVLPGGLLVDGTSDPFGRVWTANVLRRTPDTDPGWRLEALVLGWNLRGELEPEAFQTRLPKSFIHRVVPGDPVHGFVGDWLAVTEATRANAVWGPRTWFVAAGRALEDRGYAIARPDTWLRRGWLVWKNCPLEI